MQTLLSAAKVGQRKGGMDEGMLGSIQKLKKHKTALLTLSPPTTGQPLTLYVAGLDSSVSVVLVTEEEGENPTQRPIYYLSRVLQGAEHKYPPIKKLTLEVVAVARRLQPYFLAHQITIPTGYLQLQML